MPNKIIDHTRSITNIAQLLVTGQTTQYASEEDDGYWEKGISRKYTVLSTGQHAGTTNITINSLVHALSNNCVVDKRTRRTWARYVPDADIGPATDGKLYWQQYTITAESSTFNAAAKTITAAAGNPYDTGALCVGRIFTVAGTVNNNGTYTVAANAAGDVITTSEALVNEGPVDTDFATVDDLIWDFLDQANANSLGGYADWRVANCFELLSLYNCENVAPCIDTVTFPSTPSDWSWSSTTDSSATTKGERVYFNYPRMDQQTKKTIKTYYRLVRGG